MKIRASQKKRSHINKKKIPFSPNLKEMAIQLKK